MKKIITRDPKTFSYFMKKYNPEFVAVSKTPPDYESGAPYYGGRGTSDLFKAWFFFAGKDGTQDLCELLLREKISFHVNSKKELLDKMKNLGVAPKDMEKFQTMGVKKILALTMTSHSENEEQTVILEKTEKLDLEFKVGLRWIRVYPDIESRTQLKAEVEVDYKHEVDWLYGEVKINLPEGTELAEDCTLEIISNS